MCDLHPRRLHKRPVSERVVIYSKIDKLSELKTWRAANQAAPASVLGAVDARIFELEEEIAPLMEISFSNGVEHDWN